MANNFDDNQDDNDMPDGHQVDIRLPPDLEGGTWANFAMISHSMHEFTIDFIRMNFDASAPNLPTNGVVVQRVNMSPLLAQQLIDALEQNWQGYAAKSMPPEIENS